MLSNYHLLSFTKMKRYGKIPKVICSDFNYAKPTQAIVYIYSNSPHIPFIILRFLFVNTVIVTLGQLED